MADAMVLETQRWLNVTYRNVTGFQVVAEDGLTGWSTVYALTRALQHELGITALSNSFGPATLAALTTQFPAVNVHAPANIVRIVQGGLYCKGYSGWGLSGLFDANVSATVTRLKDDMGVGGVFSVEGVQPKVFKALLTMDAYVVISGGRAAVRSAQKWLNATYVGRRDFFINPCDGHFSRDVQKALLLAIQFELGMDDNTANGRFGPGTQSGIRTQAVLRTGMSDTTKRFVRLFQAAMAFNRRDVPLDGQFTAAVADAVRSFQAFTMLPQTGVADFPTWASLLVSTGDPTRRGTAADCSTQVTPERAQALAGAGYQVVGRYLTNASPTGLNKRLQPGEIYDIRDAGLAVFPIYQTYGSRTDYFNQAQGAADAGAAFEAAYSYGFQPGTRIYFAVDFDALDQDITNNVIPHFRGIAERMSYLRNRFKVGIYGPRNVCSRVAAEGLTTASFVSDMSTGFSGNLGFTLPDDWAFDQISTITVGSGAGAIEIDNNIMTGRDLGQNSFLMPPDNNDLLDVAFPQHYRNLLQTDILWYQESLGMLLLLEQQGLTKYLTPESLDIVFRHDALITAMSRAFRIRKALIQTPLYWEVRQVNVGDDLADLAVEEYYAMKEQGLPTQPNPKNDSSVEPGNMFAEVAIRARNHCIEQGYIEGELGDPDDWRVMWSEWKRLRDDAEYNISTIPLIILHNAFRMNVTSPFNDLDIQLVLQRYNGTGTEAELYGERAKGIYDIFEAYNGFAREDA